jgi:hypothetical protein
VQGGSDASKSSKIGGSSASLAAACRENVAQGGEKSSFLSGGLQGGPARWVGPRRRRAGGGPVRRVGTSVVALRTEDGTPGLERGGWRSDGGVANGGGAQGVWSGGRGRVAPLAAAGRTGAPQSGHAPNPSACTWGPLVRVVPRGERSMDQERKAPGRALVLESDPSWVNAVLSLYTAIMVLPSCARISKAGLNG